MSEKHLKKCLAFLVIREMQIKVTLKFHLKKKSEWQSSKTQVTKNVGEDVEKKEHFSIAGGVAKG